MQLKTQGKAISVGKDPLRVGHKCYMCSEQTDGEYKDLLCKACKKTNKYFRGLEANLERKVALVTGVRAKLGYEVSLKLLRYGATVVGITRFPLITKQKFMKEPDSAGWIERLDIHGVDLRSTVHLTQFLAEYKLKYSRLDILINIACQTVRRSPEYYQSLVEEERNIASRQNIVIPGVPEPVTGIPEIVHMQMHTHSIQSVQVTSSHENVNPNDYPPNKFDAFGEPLDARRKTSYNSNIGEFDCGDVLEAQLINVNAPLLIINELSCFLKARYPVFHDDGQAEDDIYDHYKELHESGQISNVGPPLSFVELQDDLFDPNEPYFPTRGGRFAYNLANRVLEPVTGRRKKIIINVTSPDGLFLFQENNIIKRGTHVNLDVSKAQLNMITNTLAQDLRKYDCYIVSVDPGWFSDNRPYGSSPINLPISLEDAATRVLQPIFHNSSRSYGLPPVWCGLLLKNYCTYEWDNCSKLDSVCEEDYYNSSFASYY